MCALLQHELMLSFKDTDDAAPKGEAGRIERICTKPATVSSAEPHRCEGTFVKSRRRSYYKSVLKELLPVRFRRKSMEVGERVADDAKRPSCAGLALYIVMQLRFALKEYQRSLTIYASADDFHPSQQTSGSSADPERCAPNASGAGFDRHATSRPCVIPQFAWSNVRGSPHLCWYRSLPS